MCGTSRAAVAALDVSLESLILQAVRVTWSPPTDLCVLIPLAIDIY